MKYAACKSEMERLEDLGQVQDLRRELQVACTTKEELGAIVQGIICESGNEKDCDANDFTSGRASYQAIKTKNEADPNGGKLFVGNKGKNMLLQ